MDKVSMSKKAFMGEHKHLLKVLRTGGHKAQVAEADDQASEMKKYRSSKRDVRKHGRS